MFQLTHEGHINENSALNIITHEVRDSCTACMNDRTRQWTFKQSNKSLGSWMSEWVNEWMNEWMNEGNEKDN